MMDLFMGYAEILVFVLMLVIVIALGVGLSQWDD